ncbi:phage head-tail connector protein [Staphylococcus caledonicus]|uniref:phage head-tail connector protein n=1 Tax=Staphylococcus TaxID=1279 RepID=UPI001F598E5C|nr:phage head-tail connector protein [Staphylococcus sp. acrmy]MCI2948337.1 phage head-tail connector protein [Staphylococcus sp. acrmy]
MAYIDGVKLLIGLNDDKQDDQLKKIIDVTEKRLIALLPKDVETVPSSLDWVIEEVAVKRYNRIGAEGMSSESIDGRSTKFQENDFDEYLSIIEDEFPSTSSKKGSIKFY